MPYNNTPIAPPEEYTGQSSLPLARVKKIIHADDELGTCSNNAAFVITIATEMFIQYLAEQTLTVVKAERKPRRQIAYRDVANAVSRIDNLEFLTDVVPKTTTYKKFKEDKAAKDAQAAASRLNGQTKLLKPARSNGTGPGGKQIIDVEEDTATPDEMLLDSKEGSHAHMEPPQDDSSTMQLQMEMRGGRSILNGD